MRTAVFSTKSYSDLLDAEVLEQLSNSGVRLVALRSAGFNNVDLAAAERLGNVGDVNASWLWLPARGA